MKNKQALTRYRLIDNLMTNKQRPAPSLQEIVDYVGEKLGTSVSVACIQKDIYAMRYDESLGYFAPIKWDRQQRGYVYSEENYSIDKIPVSEEDLQGLELAVGILEQFKHIPAIKLFEDAITRMATAVQRNRETMTGHNVLQLDRPLRYKGIEFMGDIVEAIQQKKELKLFYLPFSRKEAKKHTIHPYFVKEYKGRMYLIAKDLHPTKVPKFLTFAFDRIKDIVFTHRTFIEEAVDKENYFDAAIGVTLTGDAPERIRFRMSPEHAHYITSQPIHRSQRIIKETSKWVEVELELVINYELISMLMSYGEQICILKPKHLAETIYNKAKKMVALYMQ
jgi:hypothetical protein